MEELALYHQECQKLLSIRTASLYYTGAFQKPLACLLANVDYANAWRRFVGAQFIHSNHPVQKDNGLSRRIRVYYATLVTCCLFFVEIAASYEIRCVKI